MVKNLPPSAGDMGSVPGWGRPPGGENGYALQYSCLENSMERTWCVTKSIRSQLDMTKHTQAVSWGFFQFSSVVQLCPTVCDPHGLQHARLPCPSPTPRACSNSCPLSRWCHPTISSSVIPFSPCLQSFPASGSFPMSQFFTSGGRRIGISVSASVLPVNI